MVIAQRATPAKLFLYFPLPSDFGIANEEKLYVFGCFSVLPFHVFRAFHTFQRFRVFNRGVQCDETLTYRR